MPSWFILPTFWCNFCNTLSEYSRNLLPTGVECHRYMPIWKVLSNISDKYYVSGWIFMSSRFFMVSYDMSARTICT